MSILQNFPVLYCWAAQNKSSETLQNIFYILWDLDKNIESENEFANSEISPKDGSQIQFTSENPKFWTSCGGDPNYSKAYYLKV